MTEATSGSTGEVLCLAGLRTSGWFEGARKQPGGEAAALGSGCHAATPERRLERGPACLC